MASHVLSLQPLLSHSLSPCVAPTPEPDLLPVNSREGLAPTPALDMVALRRDSAPCRGLAHPSCDSPCLSCYLAARQLCNKPALKLPEAELHPLSWARVAQIGGAEPPQSLATSLLRNLFLGNMLDLAWLKIPFIDISQKQGGGKEKEQGNFKKLHPSSANAIST